MSAVKMVKLSLLLVSLLFGIVGNTTVATSLAAFQTDQLTSLLSILQDQQLIQELQQLILLMAQDYLTHPAALTEDLLARVNDAIALAKANSDQCKKLLAENPSFPFQQICIPKQKTIIFGILKDIEAEKEAQK